MKDWIEKNVLQGKRPYLLILALGFFIYARTIIFDFVYLDDNSLILDNFGFISRLSNIFEAFRQDVFLSFADAYYRPMMTVSLIFDAQIGGKDPSIYHFTNIIIHLITACLFFKLLMKLNYKRDISLFFSLVFTAIPVLAQAVAWVPGRNDSLLAMFVFASFIFFLKYIETRQKRFIFSHFLFFFLGIFTKETAVILTVIVIYYLHFIVKEKIISSAKKALVPGWILILVVFFLLRKLAFLNPIEMNIFRMAKSIFLNSPATIQLIGKIIFPFNLSVLPIIQDTTFIYGIISLALVFLLLFFTKKKRWDYIIFGVLWFILFLIPSFIRPNTEIVADFIEHRIYLPILGFFIVLMETSLLKKFSFKNKISVFSAVIVIIFFSVLTMMHIRNFENKNTFWRDARNHSPHYPLARRNLGAMLFLDGEYDEAEQEFKAALELNPNEQMAHNNLGLIYTNREEFQKAEEEYLKELEINPYYDNAYLNIGILYYKMERKEEAEKNWKKALEINPNMTDAIYSLMICNYSQKKFKEAAFYAKELAQRGVPLPAEFQNLLEPLNLIKLIGGEK